MKVLLFITILFSGLVGGLFYAYSCSVNIGLKSLTDGEYIKAMQSINRAIQNPLFFISFMGLLILFPITTYQLYEQPKLSFYLIVAAMIVYFAGVLGITISCNIPLNEQLANFSISAANQNEIAAMRLSFENPWTRYHNIRTIASIIAFSLAVLSAFKLKN